MTDNLQNKFANLEQILVSQHQTMMLTLNAILEALGAPPPSPGATLADVRSDLAGLLVAINGIRSDMATQQALLLSDADLILNNTETMIMNNSLNTQRLLAAIAANDPCKPCPTPGYTLPPIDTTPQTIDQEHCKRMQALIYALRRFCVKLDLLTQLGVNFSPTVIGDAFNEVLSEVGTLGPAAAPSWAELFSLVAAAVPYAVYAATNSEDLVFSFNLVADALLPALYAADSAEAGRDVYRSVVIGAGLPIPVANMLAAIGYVELFNVYYDPAASIDTTGYDGTICVPTDPSSTTEVINVPTDPYTEVDSNGYGIFQLEASGLNTRFNAETTIEATIAVEVAINRFNYDIVPANTETLVSSLRFITYVGAHDQVTTYTITYRHLTPAA